MSTTEEVIAGLRTRIDEAERKLGRLEHLFAVEVKALALEELLYQVDRGMHTRYVHQLGLVLERLKAEAKSRA